MSLCARDLRDVHVLLDWAIQGPSTWERALNCFVRESTIESNESRQQDILKAITLNLALALRQFGYGYEFRTRPQNRASLSISGPDLPPSKVVVYAYKESAPYAWIYLPAGGHKFELDGLGVRALVSVLKKAQARERRRRESELPPQTVDEKMGRV